MYFALKFLVFEEQVLKQAPKTHGGLTIELFQICLE